MSRFRQYSIGSLFNSAKDSFITGINEVKSTYSNVTSSINKYFENNK
jgi:hypothetical protein